jgi:hypothetical protein
MRARVVVGALLGTVFAVGCAGVLGLEAGDPLEGGGEAGADGTTILRDAGTTDTSVGADDGASGCGAGQKSCSGCQSVDDPNFGCTAAGCASCSGQFPEAGQVTAYGCPGCAIAACTQNYKNCDQDAANGCESNGQSDPKNCGQCGTVCVVPKNFCVAGGCSADCGAPFTVCDAACVNTTGDPYNCGGCGIACPGSPNANGVATCFGSNCGYSCNSPYARCTAAEPGCFQIGIDPTHCGPQCAVCHSPPSNGQAMCNGTCYIVCDPGFVQSGINCVPIDSGTDGGQDASCLPPNAPCNPVTDGPLCCSQSCSPQIAVLDGGPTDAPSGHCL